MKTALKATIGTAGVIGALGVLWLGATWLYAATFDVRELVAAGDSARLRFALKWQPAKVRETDPFGRTPLHEAVARPETQPAEILVRAGANVNAKDRQGRTPLHAAATDGRLNAVRLLIAAGADVNAQDRDGWTPLHCAAVHDHGSVTTVLLNAGARVNPQDKDGGTPLDWTLVLFIQEHAEQSLRQFGGRTRSELLRQGLVR
jgi:hypothetical protein